MDSKNANHSTLLIKRTKILENKKAIDRLIKSASSVNDQLALFPAFRHYNRHGLSVYLESGRGDKLSPSYKLYIQSLLKLNMEMAYGSEWCTEEKVKRREMVATEARYIFVHDVSNENVNSGDISTTLEGRERSITTTHATRDTGSFNSKKKKRGVTGSLVGFVHYRFTKEEEVPVLYVYELQLEPRVRGKDLGKFLMHLIELIARKNHMSAVVLTVLKASISAMSFYTRKLRYNISIISPSKVDALLWSDITYEILCKAFDQDAKACLEDSKYLHFCEMQEILGITYELPQSRMKPDGLKFEQSGLRKPEGLN